MTGFGDLNLKFLWILVSTVHTPGMLISRWTGTCLTPAPLSSGNPVTFSYNEPGMRI